MGGDTMAGVKLKTSEDLILLNYEADNKEQVLREICKNVLRRNYVCDGYSDALIEREKNFPTAIEFGVPIALPHIGEFCNEPFLSICTLKNAVKFYSMDGSDKELGVRIIFLFGITNAKDQVNILKNFMFAFQDDCNMNAILNAKDAKQALNVIKAILNYNVLVIN